MMLLERLFLCVCMTFEPFTIVSMRFSIFEWVIFWGLTLFVEDNPQSFGKLTWISAISRHPHWHRHLTRGNFIYHGEIIFAKTSWLTCLTKKLRYQTELKSFISCIPLRTHRQFKFCELSRKSVFMVSLSTKYILFLDFLWPGLGNIELSLPQFSVSWMPTHRKPSFLHWKKLIPYFKSALPKQCKKYLFEVQNFIERQPWLSPKQQIHHLSQLFMGLFQIARKLISFNLLS